MYVLTLVNEKGGVGKTTLAVHLSQGLACQGKRVLLVDGDPQGHSTVRCGLSKKPGLYDLLVRDAEWNEVIKTVKPERYGLTGERVPEPSLWVLPSNVETRSIAGSIDQAELLAIRLEELRGAVDVVIIDTSPTPSLLHGAFYTATHGIIYPTKLSYTSFDGLIESVKRRMAADQTRNSKWGLPPIEVVGIVPMDYRPNTLEQQNNLTELQNAFPGMVWEPINQGTIWTESEGMGRPVYGLDNASRAAADVWGMIERLEKVIYVEA